MTNTSVSCLPFLGGWFQIYFHFHFHLGKFSLVGSFAASWSFGCNLRGLENFEAILYNFGLEYFEAILETFCKNEARSEMSPLQDSNPLQGWRPCFHEESSQGNLFSFLALFNLFFCFVCFDCLFSIVAGGAWHGALRGRVDAAPLPDQQERARHHHQDPHIQVRLLSLW